MSGETWRDAATFAAQGWHRLAVALCLRAFEQGERSADLLSVLALSLRHTGRIEDSLAACLASCLAQGSGTEHLLSLARICQEVGLPGEAEGCLNEAMALDPLHPGVLRARRALSTAQSEPASIATVISTHLMRASRHLVRGDDERALAVAADLERLAPTTGAGDLIVGAVYERGGQYREAAECYASAERFAPDKARAARQRVVAKDRAEREERARPIVASIRERLTAGDDEGAARLASRLIGLVPWAPAPYLLWARLAERKGHTANALRNLREALARATWGREAIAAKIQQLSQADSVGGAAREGRAS